MLSLYLHKDIAQFSRQVKKIIKEKPKIIALQGAPRLSEEEIRFQLLEPLDCEYDVFRGDILHSTDNLLLIRSDTYRGTLIRDTEAIEWMLKSKVSMCGVSLEPIDLGPETNENRFRQLVFSIYIEPGAEEGDVYNNAFFIRKTLNSQGLSSANLILLCEFIDEAHMRLLESVFEIDIDIKSKRRTTRRRSNGT